MHAFLRAVHRLSNGRCIAKRCGGAGGTERYIAKRWGAVQRLKYVPFRVFPYLRTLLLVFRLRMHFYAQFTVLLMKGA